MGLILLKQKHAMTIFFEDLIVNDKAGPAEGGVQGVHVHPLFLGETP